MRLIKVTELAPSCVTRRRGEEAYAALKLLLANDTIEVDLDNVDIVSSSFLDGMVSRLINDSRLDDVTFLSSDTDVQRKLARISGTRSVPIYVRRRAQQRRLAGPLQFAEMKPVVVDGLSEPSLPENQASPGEGETLD